MNLLKSLSMISVITLCCRALGFMRDALIARVFGASVSMDAFSASFRISNLLRRIFAEGAFSQAFLPILVEYKNKKKDRLTRQFISYVAGFLTLTVVIISIVGVIAAPWIIKITAPGFACTPEKFTLTINLLRVTFPYILLTSLTSLIGLILNTWNQFLVPTIAPALLNLSMIVFVLFAFPIFDPPIMTLAWSVLAGGLLQISYQLPYLKKIGMLVLPKIQFYSTGVWLVIKKMGAATLAAFISQISIIINAILASFLDPGSISWMYYADRLMEFPTGVLGVALGTILLPSLSHSIIKSDYNEFSRLLDWGLRLCFLLALPSAIALGILAQPLIVTLFQYGQFSEFDTLMTQQALKGYSVGLFGIILIKVLAPAFFSRQDVKTPIYIAIISLIATQLMNLVFIGPLQHAGLSLSTGLAACINSALLYWQLRQQNLFKPQPGWYSFLFRLVLAVTIMSITLVGMITIMPDLAQSYILERFMYLLIMISAGCVMYFLTLWLTGCRIKHFLYS